MVDIFEEVEEQLRSDRYRTLALRALPWVAGVLVLALAVALAVWAWNEHQTKVSAKASESYAAAFEALQAGDDKRAFARFGETAKAGSKGYEALALMQQAGIRLTENKPAEAVTLFDQAATTAETPMIADAAALQAVYVLLDNGSAVEVEGRTKALLAEGRPYRIQAREALAMSRLMRGQNKAARDDFLVLSQNLDAPQDVRDRAGLAMSMIDSGIAASIPEVIKAAKTLPPVTPGELSQSTPQAGTAQ